MQQQKHFQNMPQIHEYVTINANRSLGALCTCLLCEILEFVWRSEHKYTIYNTAKHTDSTERIQIKKKLLSVKVVSLDNTAVSIFVVILVRQI